MALICPLFYSAAINAQAVMQSAMLWGYESVGSRYPSLLSETACKQGACQWWGYWTWAEEESQYSFTRMSAYGCTFGQNQCVQGSGSSPV